MRLARLAVLHVRRRGLDSVALLVVAVVLGAALTSLATIRDSAAGAVADSVRADMGHRQFAFQTGDPEVASMVGRMKGATAVADDNGDLTANGLTISVRVRTTTDPGLKLGQLTAGDRPRTAGQALASEVAARSLGVTIGDLVRLRTSSGTSTVTISGFSVDPADEDSHAVFYLATEGQDLRPTRWLSNIDFYSQRALQGPLDRRLATYVSLPRLLAASEANMPRFVTAMRLVPT